MSRCKAPHGGIFVFFAIGNLLWFLVALVARYRRRRAWPSSRAKQFAKPTVTTPEAPALATT